MNAHDQRYVIFLLLGLVILQSLLIMYIRYVAAPRLLRRVAPSPHAAQAVEQAQAVHDRVTRR